MRDGLRNGTRKTRKARKTREKDEVDIVRSYRPIGRKSKPPPAEAERRGPGRPKIPITREALVSHARAAFGEVGYVRASMDVIARRAGLRKSSLFHHFATKDDLYLAVFADIMGELSGFIDDARLSQGTFEERLDTLSVAVTRYLAERPDLAAIFLRELIDGGPFVNGIGRPLVEGVLASITAFLEEGLRSRANAADEDMRHLALSIAGLHLAYFAASGTSELLLARSPFEPDVVEERARAVSAQVRRLCVF